MHGLRTVVTMLELREHEDGCPSFYFWTPLEKSKPKKDKQGRHIIEGVAATPDRDAHGETVVMRGLDISYFKKFGKLNWEHRKNPEDIVGEPLDCDLNDKRFWLRGLVYPVPRGVAIVQLLDATAENDRPALGFSVEGKVLERDPKDQSRIIRAMVVNVAITANPVNANTYADLVKALTASGWAKTMTTASGAALVPQDLEREQKDLGWYVKAHMAGVGCHCLDDSGRFVHDYPGALRHFHDCLGAPLNKAAALAADHRRIAGMQAKRSA